jgi:prophage antirepressor-like protein
MGKGEIVLYQPQNESIAIDVLVEKETVWLSRAQLAELFGRDVKTIGKHINNALREELERDSVVAKFATTAADGKIYQTNHYNLDMIISVGYRVKSNRGVQFRRWATQVLKEYTLRGYAISHRFERLENRVTETEKQIEFFVKTALPPHEGVFFDGQVFDAYAFASDLVKRAGKRIILFDNYVDETVLLLLSKRKAAVRAEIYTGKISRQLRLDLAKHNTQYEPITIHQSLTFHDRFLIIDNTVYHIGASLKDLGKKLFAFSKMAVKPSDLLKNI